MPFMQRVRSGFQSYPRAIVSAYQFAKSLIIQRSTRDLYRDAFLNNAFIRTNKLLGTRYAYRARVTSMRRSSCYNIHTHMFVCIHMYMYMHITAQVEAALS